MGLVREPKVCIIGVPTVRGLSNGVVFPAKGFQLLTLLASTPGYQLARKEVASILWDSDTDEGALANLRQLVARLRRCLPAAVLVVEPKTVSLGRNRTEIDLCLFEAVARLAPFPEITSALLLVRGDLLAGMDDATDTFSHWLLRERAALRERFFTTASGALIELTRYGRAPRAELDLLAERMLALEPEREASYRVLIDAYGRNGMFEEADRLYRRLGDMLRAEHGSAPAPETVAVARRVFASRSRYETSVQVPHPAVPKPRVAFIAPAFLAFSKHPGLLLAFVEDVANELARYRSVMVLAPHSSINVQHDSGLPADNTTLRADYTVSGFVRAANGDDHALSLRMTDCESKSIVWAGQFRVATVHLPKSFSMLVHRVALSLASSLDQSHLENASRRGSVDGYMHYLEGQRAVQSSSDLRRLRRARARFESSVASDPSLARARAGIAQTLYLEWIQLGGDDPQLLVNAREQAKLAVHLDPNDGVGHWMEGTVALYQRDFDHCAEKMAEAEALCPHSADLLVQYGDALAHLGDPDAGWERFERALDLNPTPPDHYWWAGASIAFRRQDYARVVELCAKLASDDAVLGMLGASYAYLGDLETARSYGNRIKELFPGSAAAHRSKVVPDRPEIYRTQHLEGLRLAGVL